MRIFFIVLINIILIIRISKLYAFSLKIILKDSISMSPISNAIVILSNQEINKIIEYNSDNVYNFENIKDGIYNVKIYMEGYYKENIIFEVKSDITKVIYLYPYYQNMEEIRIIGNKNENLSSKITFSKNDIKNSLKGIMNDPIEPLKNMSGGLTDPYINYYSDYYEGLTKLKIRGGNYYENNASLEGVRISYPYHNYLYPDSIFIEDLIENISLYRGLLPVKFGDALSSYLDVKIIEKDEGLHGMIKNGVMSSSLSIFGSIDNEKLKISAGIRRIHLDVFQKFIIETMKILRFTDNLPPSDFPTAPYYIDTQGKVLYNITDYDKIKFIWFYTIEPFFNYRLNTNISLGTQTNIYHRGSLSIVYNKDINKNSIYEQIFSYNFNRIDSLYLMSSLATNYLFTFMKQKFCNEDNINLKSLFKFNFLKEYNLESGFDFIYYPYISYVNSVIEVSNNISTNYLLNNKFINDIINGAFFCDFSFPIFEHIYLNPGIRLNWYKIINKYSFDIRMNLIYKFDKYLKLYFSSGNISQFPDKVGLLEWMEINTNLDIPGNIHYILGMNWNIIDFFDVNLELYYKDYYNNLTANYVNSNLMINTKGSDKNIYGVDFIMTMKRDKYPIYGWLSFSSYCVYGYREDSLNDAKGYGLGGITGYVLTEQIPVNSISGAIETKIISPPIKEWYIQEKLDYKITLNLNYEILKNLILNGEFNYISGRYFTPIIEVSNNIALYGKYNSAKLPDFHYLNLKLDWNFELFGFFSGLSFQFYNVYNNQEILAYRYNEEGKIEENIKYYIGFYPSLVFWIEW